MAVKSEKPFKLLAVSYDARHKKTAVFSITDKPGAWIEPYTDTITWCEFSVYGVPDTKESLDKTYEDDFSLATKIGEISGYHIPIALIEDFGEDSYAVCDNTSSDLEAMHSVLQEHRFLEDFIDSIFYIHEIELSPAYQGFGYEKLLLLQLPALVANALNNQPSLLMYYPAPIQYDEPERDLKAEAALRHRMEYNMQLCKREDNIALFPPIYEVSDREINRVLGRRNPGDTAPIAYRNKALYKLYESAGFTEIGQTGWLSKHIASVFTKDGLNH